MPRSTERHLDTLLRPHGQEETVLHESHGQSWEARPGASPGHRAASLYARALHAGAEAAEPSCWALPLLGVQDITDQQVRSQGESWERRITAAVRAPPHFLVDESQTQRFPSIVTLQFPNTPSPRGGSEPPVQQPWREPNPEPFLAGAKPTRLSWREAARRPLTRSASAPRSMAGKNVSSSLRKRRPGQPMH